MLEKSGEKFEVIKYLDDVPSAAELKTLVQYLDISPMDLVRKNESIWKEKYKGKNLSNDEILEAMAQHPKLIERPIVVNGTKAVVGRPAERIHDVL